MDEYLQVPNRATCPFPAQLIIEPEELMKAMEDLKIKNIKMDGEGLLNNPEIRKHFLKNYYGDIGVYEIIGENNEISLRWKCR